MTDHVRIRFVWIAAWSSETHPYSIFSRYYKWPNGMAYLRNFLENWK